MSTTSPHEWLRRVSDYHTGGVDAAEVEAVESHLATCEDCRQALAVFRRFYALASSPLRLGEPSSVVAEQLALRKDRASDLIGSDALEDRPNPRGSRRSVGNRRLMGLASVLAASLVIVGFFTVLGPRIGGGSRIGGAGKHVRSTLQPNQTSDVPITPVATPGAQSKFVTNILTAKGVSPTFVPIDVTSHFTVGDTVDVICLVRGVSGSQKHILSVHWFFNGTDMQIPQIQGTTTEPVTKDAYVYFSLTYPSVGSVWRRYSWTYPVPTQVIKPTTRIWPVRSPLPLSRLIRELVQHQQLEAPCPRRLYVRQVPRHGWRCDRPLRYAIAGCSTTLVQPLSRASKCW